MVPSSGIWTEWNSEWATNASMLRDVRASVYDPLSQPANPTYLYRLRIAHFDLSRIHLISSTAPSPCPHCSFSPVSAPYLLSRHPPAPHIRQFKLMSHLPKKKIPNMFTVPGKYQFRSLTLTSLGPSVKCAFLFSQNCFYLSQMMV